MEVRLFVERPLVDEAVSNVVPGVTDWNPLCILPESSRRDSSDKLEIECKMRMSRLIGNIETKTSKLRVERQKRTLKLKKMAAYRMAV